jgi:hypothetical protein|tara:strand:- start:269 stop:610 length:342 start_codon:yes stop_codon:yes gene_type:complete
MAVPSPKKTPKNLKKPMKPKRRPLRESPRPKKRPDIIDVSPPEEADQLLVPKKKDGGKFPDLNKDGKVTFADVLKGRGVDKKASGGKVTKMGMGGKCRGMGAATRGGAFTRNG